MGKENSFESSHNVSGAGDFMTHIWLLLISLWGRLIFLLSGVRCRILLST